MNRSQLARQPQIPVSENHTTDHMQQSTPKGADFLGFGKNGLARQPQIPVSENHTTDLMQQSTPKGADFLGFGKNGAKTYQEVPLDHEYCRWIDQVEDQQPHWKLKRFSSWLKMQSVFQEPNV